MKHKTYIGVSTSLSTIRLEAPRSPKLLTNGGSTFSAWKIRFYLIFSCQSSSCFVVYFGPSSWRQSVSRLHETYDKTHALGTK